MDGRIDMILDGGPVEIGLESTIVDFTEEVPMVLRPGYINLQMLREVLGEVRVDPGILSANEGSVRPKAPGMRYRHYAPRAPLLIVEGTANAVTGEINRRAAEDMANGLSVGIIASAETVGLYREGLVREIGSRETDEEIARHLFDVLRAFDEDGVDRIYSEAFDTPKLGMAIMNRLLRAAGHRVVRV
ncbi:MAG: L-threonylcarbamoyladenylate synthase, partial [Lachnospiraceae bacterium]